MVETNSWMIETHVSLVHRSASHKTNVKGKYG